MEPARPFVCGVVQTACLPGRGRTQRTQRPLTREALRAHGRSHGTARQCRPGWARRTGSSRSSSAAVSERWAKRVDTALLVLLVPNALVLAGKVADGGGPAMLSTPGALRRRRAPQGAARGGSSQAVHCRLRTAAAH